MSAVELQVILLSIKVAVLSTALTLPFAIWLGWISARKTFPLKSVMEALISLPLTAPPVVTGYLLLLLLGRHSFLGSAVYEIFGIRLTFSFAALVIASMVVSLPLSVRSIRAAFELIDPAYEYASQTLGASKFASFFRVTLPLAIPGVLSGAVLGFARSLGEFGATITFAGNVAGVTQTLPLAVYSALQVPGEELTATRFVICSLVLCFATLFLSEWSTRRARHRMES